MAVTDLLTFDNAVFKAYVFWSAILVMKMLLMSGLTVMAHYKKKLFRKKDDQKSKKPKPNPNEVDYERVRRAHRNDLENILPFFVIGFLYVLTNPWAFLAINLFRIVALARIVHTVVYAVVIVPQPARGLSFAVALFATIYMALQVVCYAL